MYLYASVCIVVVIVVVAVAVNVDELKGYLDFIKVLQTHTQTVLFIVLLSNYVRTISPTTI